MSNCEKHKPTEKEEEEVEEEVEEDKYIPVL
jgi:hypothetical protein